MTGRERLEAILHKQPADGLSWTTHITHHTLDALLGELRGMPGLDFYRYIGYDILLLNGARTDYTFSSPTLELPDQVWGASNDARVIVRSKMT